MTSLETLTKDLASSKFVPVFLFHGPEEFLIEQAVDLTRKKYLSRADEDFNLDIVYGSEVDGARIINLASAYPMLAPMRVVIVREFDRLAPRQIELVGKYCTRASKSTCLILSATHVDLRRKGYTEIKANGYVMEFKTLYDNRVPEWIQQHCQQRQLEISVEAVRLLHASIGNSLRALATEINKLTLLLKGRTRIEVADVEQVVGVSRQFNIFELCNAVGTRKLGPAMQIARRMLELGEAPTVIIYMLGRHITILMKVKELIRKHQPELQIAKEVGVNQFFIKDYINQQQNYSMTDLQSAIQFLLDADIKMKTSYQKANLVMDLLLYQITQNITYDSYASTIR